VVYIGDLAFGDFDMSQAFSVCAWMKDCNLSWWPSRANGSQRRRLAAGLAFEKRPPSYRTML